jgi:hypothetical protein
MKWLARALVTTIGLLLITEPPLSAQIKYGLRDEDGRHVIARGFVVTTNDGRGEVFFDADDYARMVRLGANYQVIRLELGRLSKFPGCQVEEDYLLKLDALVDLGRNSGMKTVFKMTRYGVEDFSWEEFWLNQHHELGIYTDAWKTIWTRYQDEASVAGYDLINEPRKDQMDISYDELTVNYLVPHHQTLIEQCHEINAAKVCLCQAIFMNKGEGIEHNQYAEIKVPIGRDNIYLSPHIYLDEGQWVEPVMKRLINESHLQEAPMFIGEWGFPTFDTTDASIEEQQEYAILYQQTAAEFDRLGVGTIKAWFAGTRTKQHFLPGGPSTWSIFSDQQDVGTVERKYITDIIARPYPQAIAGDIRSFRFDFATRRLTVSLTTDNSKGSSQIFVGADRHYPDGFSIVCDDQLILCHNPLRSMGLEVYQSGPHANPADFIWNDATQQLTVLKWPADNTELNLQIVPGINNGIEKRRVR